MLIWHQNTCTDKQTKISIWSPLLVKKLSQIRGYANRDTSAYDIWGCGVTEIEVDILTGEKNVRRVDLIEDTGSSVNPAIDIGQMEGAFVMSLGLWLSEQLKFDPNTGRLLTVDTWVMETNYWINSIFKLINKHTWNTKMSSGPYY